MDRLLTDLLDRAKAAGADLRLKDGKLQAKGLECLPPDLLAELKARKAEIALTLAFPPVTRKPDPEPQPEPTAPGRYDNRRRRVPPGLKRIFREKACPWILANLDALTAAGWTAKRLFRCGPGNAVFRWGLAWGDIWDRASEVKLLARGEVVFTIQEPNRTVVQVSRPTA
jgi:hypothetical protein